MHNRLELKKYTVLIIFLMLQVLILLASTSYQYFVSINLPSIKHVSSDKVYQTLLVTSLIISGLMIFTFKGIIKLINKETEAKITEQRLKDSQELVQVLRANHHDFINHFQVISGAAQLGKLDVIERYSHDVVKQVREISVISNIYYPEIAALLYTKVAKAETLGAKVSININTNLQEMPIAPIDLSRILGNLLDNALYAINELEEFTRELAIEIIEDNKSFTFKIFNRYPIIPREIQADIFKPGYTTKGEKGSDLGLYNVKSIVDKYHGKLNLISQEDTGTAFVITLNKK